MFADEERCRITLSHWLRRHWVPGVLAAVVIFSVDLFSRLGPIVPRGTLLMGRWLVIVSALAMVTFWLAVSFNHVQERRKAGGVRSLERARHKRRQRRLHEQPLPDDSGP